MRSILRLLTISGSILLSCENALPATITYSGSIGDYWTGAPLAGGFVIAGTFSPGFDPFLYNCFYGDGSCNQLDGAYESAVADGHFLPIGAGTFTDLGGAFSSLGETSAPEGTPLWLFAFGSADTEDFAQALFSSSDPGWRIPGQPGGEVRIETHQADVFVMGSAKFPAVQMGLRPIPEPGSSTLLGFAVLIFLGRRRRKV